MVLLDFSLTPLGKGESVSAYVARCLEVVAASGLDYRLHAMGTTLEGELNEVLAVVRRCFEALQADCNRISCSIKIDYRQGPGGRLQSKVQKVQELVQRPSYCGCGRRAYLFLGIRFCLECGEATAACRCSPIIRGRSH